MKIERKQLKEIEFLFSQSAKGIHFLFDDKKKLTNVLSTPIAEKKFFDSKNKEKIKKIFKDLLSKKNLQEKKIYLDTLNAENFAILVRTYFHIVDSALLTQNKTMH